MILFGICGICMRHMRHIDISAYDAFRNMRYISAACAAYRHVRHIGICERTSLHADQLALRPVVARCAIVQSNHPSFSGMIVSIKQRMINKIQGLKKENAVAGFRICTHLNHLHKKPLAFFTGKGTVNLIGKGVLMAGVPFFYVSCFSPVAWPMYAQADPRYSDILLHSKGDCRCS